MRERHQVFHLFVGTPWRGQGLSRTLRDAGRNAAIAAGGTPPFSVNTSNDALDAYRRLGFMQTAPTAVKNGIIYTAIEWNEPCCK
jgi:predicted GNAT family acetyltransferase